MTDSAAWWDSHYQQLLDDYFTFLKFKSISTDPEYKDEVLSCAEWVQKTLSDMGLDVERWETGGYPALFATDLKAGAHKPTLLIYHHYDVQPIDPIELWDTPPFEPTLKDGKVYARGASDNKGQCFFTLCAIKATYELFGSLGFNLKLLIEGEEEIGSPGLGKIAESKAEDLKADYMFVIDVDMPEPGVPGISLGIRGITTIEVKIQNADADLHSGNHGGIALNSSRVLADLLAKCWNEDGMVAVDGFYDEVQSLQKTDQLDMDFDEDDYSKAFGVKAFANPKGKTPLEANWLMPTLEINGMESGYTGEGFKTIIPASATAKISARLVFDQDPEKIAKCIADYLQKHAPKGVSVEASIHHGGRAMQTSSDAPIAQLAAQAFSEIFQKRCKFIMTGGSIPIASVLEKLSGASALCFGVALSSDAIHSPNEHFEIERLRLGCLSLAQLFKLIKT